MKLLPKLVTDGGHVKLRPTLIIIRATISVVLRKRKKASKWWIATLHWFIARILVPYLLGVVFYLSAGSPATVIDPRISFDTIFNALPQLMFIVVGVILSAFFLTRYYEISNGAKIANLASLIYIGLDVLLNLWIFILGTEFFGIPPFEVSWFLGALNIFVFYFASRLFIASNV